MQKGAGFFTQRSFNPQDGTLTGVATGALAGASVTGTVQALGYGYDGLGNLTARSDALRGRTENCTYDSLNRLLTASVVGGSTASTTYLGNGNIDTKTDVSGNGSGPYTYDPGKPHAVRSAFGYQMSYDANGNLATRTGNGQTWFTRWAGFDKPRWLGQGSTSDTTGATFKGSEFHYNAARWRAAAARTAARTLSLRSPRVDRLHHAVHLQRRRLQLRPRRQRPARPLQLRGLGPARC